ncbi:uncharacterized protein PHACADRAFT_171771, partial [Phanerochaete carnosa HHB-10118-sp]
NTHPSQRVLSGVSHWLASFITALSIPRRQERQEHPPRACRKGCQAAKPRPPWRWKEGGEEKEKETVSSRHQCILAISLSLSLGQACCSLVDFPVEPTAASVT